MDDDSISSLVVHHNAPKFLVHVRNGCLRKAAGSSSPGSDVSNNRVAHYQSPGLGCALSWMPLSARPWAPVSSNVSCWLIRSEFCHILGFLIHIHQCFKSVSRCIGGCKITVLTSLVKAVSGVEDATAAIRDTRDNLVSREPWVSLPVCAID